MRNPERILVFELNWLGDILFSFPFIRAIRKKYPDSFISCVVVPRYVDLLIHNPWVNDVHVLSDDNRLLAIGEKAAFIRMIARERYDTCFFLKPSRNKVLMAGLAGIRERIGFSGKRSPLTREVDMPPANIHRADQILSLAAAVDIYRADGTYEYFYGEEDEKRAKELLHSVGGGLRRLVALNPGGNWDVKRWPEKNFINLAKRILTRFSDVEVLVTGAPKDRTLAEGIVAGVNDKRCYSIAGRTRLNELAAIFRSCDLVVSADSGPLHLASAVGSATIGLFCPTSPKITGPRGKGENIVIIGSTPCAVPCYNENCPDCIKGMRDISPDKVMEAAGHVLVREIYRKER